VESAGLGLKNGQWTALVILVASVAMTGVDRRDLSDPYPKGVRGFEAVWYFYGYLSLTA
jgi:hypothetical protein